MSYREPKKITPEGQIKRDVKQYLTLKGWRIIPILQGLGAYKGISDLIALKEGVTIYIEVKTPSGKLSAHQEAFRILVRETGNTYIVVRSVDDLIKEGY